MRLGGRRAAPSSTSARVAFVGAQIYHPRPSYAERTTYARTHVPVFYMLLSRPHVHAPIANAGA